MKLNSPRISDAIPFASVDAIDAEIMSDINPATSLADPIPEVNTVQNTSTPGLEPIQKEEIQENSTFADDDAKNFNLEKYESILYERSILQKEVIYTSGFQLVPSTFYYGRNLPHFVATLRFVMTLMETGLPEKSSQCKYAVDASPILHSFPTLGGSLAQNILVSLSTRLRSVSNIGLSQLADLDLDHTSKEYLGDKSLSI